MAFLTPPYAALASRTSRRARRSSAALAALLLMMGALHMVVPRVFDSLVPRGLAPPDRGFS